MSNVKSMLSYECEKNTFLGFILGDNRGALFPLHNGRAANPTRDCRRLPIFKSSVVV